MSGKLLCSKSFRWSVMMAMGVVAASGVGLAPAASASVAGVGITTAPGYGSVAGHYGAGCTYRVAAIVDGPDPVTITARRLGGPAVTILYARPARGRVGVAWTPPAPGRYVLTASQGGSSDTVTAQVGLGVQFPWFFGRGQCAVLIP